MPLLNEEELKQIEQQLQFHHETLQTHLGKARHTAEGERYLDIAGTVHSQSGASFAELSTVLSNASLGRETDALREVEEALQRIRAHSYGYCVDCGQAIARERLYAYPVAKRCLHCQQREEDRHGGKDVTPSL